MRDMPEPSLSDLATYIAERCVELRHLARAPRFRSISYLLGMVHEEAERIAKDELAERRRAGPPPR